MVISTFETLPLFRGMFLRAVCYSDTQGWLGFPWPLCLKRGWAKTCATLPWPIRGWSLQVLFSVLTPRSPIGASGCQGCAAPSAARPGLDAGATGDYLASPFKDGKPQRPEAGQGSGSRTAPTREASPAMGSLPRRPGPRAHSPASKRPLDLPWERSDARGAWGHVAPPHGAPAHARAASARAEARLTRPLARAGIQTTVAVLLVRAARPSLDAGALRQYIAKPGKESGKATEGQRQERRSRLPPGAKRLTEPPSRGGRGVAGISGTGRAQRRRCLPCVPPGGR